MSESLITKLTNQYIKIEVPKRALESLQFDIYYLKIGETKDQDNTAAFQIELLDWAGSNYVGEIIKTIVNYKNIDICLLSYANVSRANQITEEEFYNGVVNSIINQAKDNKKDEAFYLNFKSTPERRALLKTLMKSPKVGITL